jgi:hypothetical protein
VKLIPILRLAEGAGPGPSQATVTDRNKDAYSLVARTKLCRRRDKPG